MPATRPGPVEVPTEIDVHVPDGATPGTKLRCALSWGQYILVTVRATKRNYLSMVIGRYISSHLPVALTAVPVAPAIPASFLHCIPCAGATKCYCRPNLYRAKKLKFEPILSDPRVLIEIGGPATTTAMLAVRTTHSTSQYGTLARARFTVTVSAHATCVVLSRSGNGTDLPTCRYTRLFTVTATAHVPSVVLFLRFVC